MAVNRVHFKGQHEACPWFALPFWTSTERMDDDQLPVDLSKGILSLALNSDQIGMPCPKRISLIAYSGNRCFDRLADAGKFAAFEFTQLFQSGLRLRSE